MKSATKNLMSKTIQKPPERRLIYVYAEYCPGDFFWGWWLYFVAVIDGKINYDNYEWIHSDIQLNGLMEALGLPVLHDYRGDNHQKYIDAFLQKYPNGVFLWDAEEFPGLKRVSAPLPIEPWEALKQVRETQLLRWKNSDEGYLSRCENTAALPT